MSQSETRGGGAGDAGGVSYTRADAGYFEKRHLQRYAGIWSLWALGVGAVISGHFSGWNFGIAPAASPFWC